MFTSIVTVIVLLDGVLSYSMRQGDRRGPDLDFSDFTYDGKVKEGSLSDGLGQLTDLEEGNTNFRLDLQNLGKKGYEWVAWKNESHPNGNVEIVFRFDQVFNFSAVRITANNVPNREVSVFKRALVFFSIGGIHFGSDAPVVFNYSRDTTVESARHVFVPIPHHVGRFLKLLLFFDTRWIMISEIRFFGGMLFLPESFIRGFI